MSGQTDDSAVSTSARSQAKIGGTESPRTLVLGIGVEEDD